MLGSLARLFIEEDPDLANTKSGRAMLEMAPDRTEEQLQKVYDAINYIGSGQPGELGISAAELVADLHGGDKRASAWERHIEAVERHNDPGRFTALIGFEWSSTTDGANLHRVVFQAEGGDVGRQYIPYSYLESDDPEDLWAWLDATSERTGANFVAIPHNPNISLGMFFPLVRNSGEDVDEGYAQKRMQWDGRARQRVGNTVDLETGRYSNTIGAAQLTAAWTDPDFDPDQHAFYYVRALEIPTPRYSLLDAIALGIDWQETNRARDDPGTGLQLADLVHTMTSGGQSGPSGSADGPSSVSGSRYRLS